MSKYSIIITAGGIGKRMQSVLPKQFIQVRERPILMYTIELFYHFDPKAELILTLPEEWLNYWENLMVEFDFRIPHCIVEGGKERYDSIKNALDRCHGDYIAVHDGVRPLVSEDTLRACFREVRDKGAVIPVLPVTQSLRRIVDEGETESVDRSQYMTVQTPQCFKREILEEAYQLPFHSGITDDASLVEDSGVKISTVIGNIENIKITTQADLKYAEMFLK